MKKFIALSCCIAGLLLCIAAKDSGDDNLRIMVNGEAVQTDAVVEKGSTYVPVRAVFEQMGCTVGWDAETKTASIIYKGRAINFCFYDEEVIIVKDRMYVPLRMAVEALGVDIDWDDETKTVIIDTADTADDKDVPYEIMVNDSSSFAFRLNELMPDDVNYMFSPYSIKCALAMAANGGDREVVSEITAVLDIFDLDKFNDSVGEYIESQQPRDLSSWGPEYEGVTDGTCLNIANAVWLNGDYTEGGDFSQSFKDKIEQKYDGTAKTVSSSNAVQEINNWCAEKTNDKIKSIIDDPNFAACLTNAVYFKGNWYNEFSKAATKKDEFTDRNGNKNEIDFMNQQNSFKYYEDDNVQMISMPYKSSSLSMYIALTDDKPVDIEKYIDKMTNEQVNVSVPKFKTEYSMSVKRALKQLGIECSFESDAPHFSAMFNDAVNKEGNICISDILHKTYIDVDEEGTEAAAVTAVLVENEACITELPEKIYEFKADKPFTYLIRDDKTGDIIFMGEYAYTE